MDSHQFSPFQLFIGQNPSIPYAATDKLLVLSSTQTIKMIQQHLSNIHEKEKPLLCMKTQRKPIEHLDAMFKHATIIYLSLVIQCTTSKPLIDDEDLL